MEHGVAPRFLKEFENGLTVGIAVLDKGDGPVIGVGVDIDGLRIAESDDSSHRPLQRGSSSNTSWRERVENAADTIDGITTVHGSRPVGTDDDGAHLMEAIRNGGGSATYTIVGADLASGHHTDTVDIDEHVLVLATDLLTNFVNLDSARDQ